MSEEKKKKGGPCCNANLIKPPLVHRAVVVVINDIPAADFLAVQQGQYPALDAVARDGSGATLMSPPTQSVLDELSESPRVEIIPAATLAAAEEFLEELDTETDNDNMDDKEKEKNKVRTLVAVLISGSGEWSSFYKAPEQLDDDFIIPKQSFDATGTCTVPRGVGCWASPARARVDYRKWIADPQPPAEGAISAQQVATEILSKVGRFPKFGA